MQEELNARMGKGNKFYLVTKFSIVTTRYIGVFHREVKLATRGQSADWQSWSINNKLSD